MIDIFNKKTWIDLDKSSVNSKIKDLEERRYILVIMAKHPTTLQLGADSKNASKLSWKKKLLFWVNNREMGIYVKELVLTSMHASTWAVCLAVVRDPYMKVRTKIKSFAQLKVDISR